MLTIARNVLRARLEQGLTQREVGVALEMDARGISRWENAKVMPSNAKLAQLARFFKREPGWFFVDHEMTGRKARSADEQAAA